MKRMQGLIAASRYLILLPAAGCFAAATALLLYGSAEVVHAIEGLLNGKYGEKGAKALTLALIEVVDLYLMGTVFYIISLGLYELFIDDGAPLPAWLSINNLDDLKDKLTGVIVLVMGVLFLGQVVTWDGQKDLLPYGASVALVIAALTFFLMQRGKKPKPAGAKTRPAEPETD